LLKKGDLIIGGIFGRDWDDLLEMQKVDLTLTFVACNLLVHRRLCQQIGDVYRIATYLNY
jgi:hypothetical protein